VDDAAVRFASFEPSDRTQSRRPSHPPPPGFTDTIEEAMMFGIGMPELIIILVIILIIFGAGKLPEIGAGMGKAIKSFKSATAETEGPNQEKIEEDAGKTDG
jgi:sec-independent protein translocase protein TatA